MTVQTLSVTDKQSELQAAKLANDGLDAAQIAARFDPPLSVDGARAVIMRGRHELGRRSAPRPSQPAPAAAQAPDEIEQLLTWAEADGSQRAATLAARTRGQLAELRSIQENSRLAVEARAQVAAAEQALVDAKARLRDLNAGHTPAAGGLQSPSAPSVIRAWANSNGYEVPPRGRVPSHILGAYADAHPGSAAE